MSKTSRKRERMASKTIFLFVNMKLRAMIIIMINYLFTSIGVQTNNEIAVIY